MSIITSSLLLFSFALALLLLKMTPASVRAVWLTAVGGAALGLISVIVWLGFIPFEASFPAWQPRALFPTPILFRADEISFPLALSLMALTFAVLLTESARSMQASWASWAGMLALGGLGLLAVSANNPLTLLLIWSALDLTELLAQLRSVEGIALSEKVVIAFSTRLLGSGLLLWANTVSFSGVNQFDFHAIAPSAGLYLIAAAGLRLGVLPLHLPYAAETIERRGIGTSFRLIPVASSFVLLARVPPQSLSSPVAPWLGALAGIAALYSGWMWLRAPDELEGRPHWVIGIAALAVLSALSGNPLGATAWGAALILVGGALFLFSAQQRWLNYAMLLGVWSISALPFSMTATVWTQPLGWLAPITVISQSLLIAGFTRHALRSSSRILLEEQPAWMRTTYLAGIFILLLAQVFLTVTGWAGALQLGAWGLASASALLAGALMWASPRFRILNPLPTQWIQTAESRVNNIYQGFWTLYRLLERLSQTVTALLEGDSGMMWTLLFLILFISYFIQAGR